MNIKTILKYFLSFFKTNWQLSDYPIKIKHYKIKPQENPNTERFKQILVSATIINWWQMSGNGDTRKEAITDLEKKFNNYKKEYNSTPRPGIKVPLEFVDSSGVEEYQEVVDDFLIKIMNKSPEEVMLTDGSSIWDFHGENSNDKFYKKILEIYNVDVSDIEDGNILKIIKRISDKK